MGGKLNFRHTKQACILAYITQAAVNNLPPLLFLTFQQEFSISLEAITMLISINFGIQLITDLVFAKQIDRMGYRRAAVLSHILAAVGLFSLGTLPYALPNPFAGICIAAAFNAVGGGLAEVLISPIIEAVPGEKKEAEMSMMHSFYCWGQAGVILLSTLYFIAAGIELWRYLPMLWALIPLYNIFFFARVPLCKLVEKKEEQMPVRQLFKQLSFWIVLLLMVCSGATELGMAQWASLFAETGLRVSKTLGDLLGPCAFGILMGLSRTIYGFYGNKINLNIALAVSSVGCIFSYLLAVFSPFPVLALTGCALCGFSVGILWPGMTSLSAGKFRTGGTAMFAYLALAGDLGCFAGPTLAGAVSEFTHSHGITLFGGGYDEVRLGLLCVTLFPMIMPAGILALRKIDKSENI